MFEKDGSIGLKMASVAAAHSSGLTNRTTLRDARAETLFGKLAPTRAARSACYRRAGATAA